MEETPKKVVTVSIGGVKIPVGTEREVWGACIWAVVLVVILWLTVGREIIKDVEENKAIARVKSYQIKVALSGGSRDWPIALIVTRYDPEQKTMLISGLDAVRADATGGSGWSARKVGGERYLVTCRAKNHFYEFETNLVYVHPVNDIAQQLFDLRDKSFSRREPF